MKVNRVGSISQNEKNVKAVLAFMLIVLASGILMLFNNYKESIIASGLFQIFMILVITCMALLLSLLYLVNKK